MRTRPNTLIKSKISNQSRRINSSNFIFIQLVLNSKSYYYEVLRSQVKLKYKCQRRTIVFPNFEFKCEENYENEIKALFENFQSGDKIKSIEKTSSKIIFVTFGNEEETFEVYKKFETYKFASVKSILTRIYLSVLV